MQDADRNRCHDLSALRNTLGEVEAGSVFAEKGAGAVWQCYSVLPMSLRGGRSAAPAAFTKVGGLVDLIEHIRYTTPSKDVVGTLDLDLPFKGALFARLHRQCRELLDKSSTD